jgi:hypothetical protein
VGNRLTALSLSTALLWLAVTAPALAREGGEGLYGKTNDTVITNFGFGLMIFFLTIVVVFSLIQAWLIKRKAK